MSFVLNKPKKQRRTTELLLNELESLYILLKIAPDRDQVVRMIKEREKILIKRGVQIKEFKEIKK